MTISSNLMKAILSLDAYNRGYNAGIIFGNNPGNNDYSLDVANTQIGNATIITNSSLLEDDNGNTNIDDNIGFYGIAYSYNGETIIAYRGTDDMDDADTDGTLLTLDQYHGWPLGATNTDSEQGQMAA